MEKKRIEFNRIQFLNVLKLVYLGRWMFNSHDEPDEIEMNSETEQAEQFIYENAKNFNLTEYIDYDQDSEKYFPSQELEADMDSIITEYDEYTFWDELAWRMAERDFSARFDNAQMLCMTTDEIFREKNIIADKYFAEFKIDGISNLNLTK